MTQYKKILPIIIITAMFLLVGCNTEQAPTTQESKVFLGGTEGVTAKFDDFGVTEEGVFSLFDSETFSIDVVIQNKGEYEIQPGEVTLKLLGPAKDEFTGIKVWELKKKEIIDKKSTLVPTGGEENLPFAEEAKYNGKVVGLLDRIWFANIEYRYNTNLILPEICLKEDLTDKRICEPTEAKTFHVSGAPVTVTAVEESTAGKGVMALKISVSKSGSGKLTLPGTDFSVNNEKIAYTIDDPAWECKSGGKVNEARLIEGKADIVCKLKAPLAKDTLSTKKLGLVLDYKYRDIIQETLRIKESAK